MATDMEQYIVDKKGTPHSVIINIKDYHRMLQELEELESIRAYDAAKASKEKPVPFEEAVAEIERGSK